MSTPYDPLNHSIVQAMTGEKHEAYEATDFHEALLFAIAREIGRVHYNRYQTSWDRWSDDPHIPGIQWRDYITDCGCPEENDSFIPQHAEDCPAIQPNFGFASVEFRWYKNPGRGMSVNKILSATEWASWFNDCIAKIREFDIKFSSTQNILSPIPTRDAFYSAKCHVFYKVGEFPTADEKRIPAMNAIEKNAIAGDFLKPDWPKLVPEDLKERNAFMRGVFYGVAAEKFRAQNEDRPRQK